jgi:hypothetical protein
MYFCKGQIFQKSNSCTFTKVRFFKNLTHVLLQRSDFSKIYLMHFCKGQIFRKSISCTFAKVRFFENLSHVLLHQLDFSKKRISAGKQQLFFKKNRTAASCNSPIFLRVNPTQFVNPQSSEKNYNSANTPKESEGAAKIFCNFPAPANRTATQSF